MLKSFFIFCLFLFLTPIAGAMSIDDFNEKVKEMVKQGYPEDVSKKIVMGEIRVAKWEDHVFSLKESGESPERVKMGEDGLEKAKSDLAKLKSKPSESQKTIIEESPKVGSNKKTKKKLENK